MNTISYNFFDLKTLHVHSESIRALAGVENLLGNFRCNGARALPTAEEHVFLEEINEGKWRYQLSWDSDSRKAEILDSQLINLNFLMNQRILFNLPYLFVHASVVSRGSDVLVFMGDSGYGKTTLCLALLSQGFKYLSDEYAVFDLAGGRILPYPRGGFLHAESLRLLKELHPRFDLGSTLCPQDVIASGAKQSSPSPLGERAGVRGIASAITLPRNDVLLSGNAPEGMGASSDEFIIINPVTIFPESLERRCKYERIFLFLIFPGTWKKGSITPALPVEAINGLFCHAKNLSSICKLGRDTAVDSIFQFVQETSCFYLKQGPLAGMVESLKGILKTSGTLTDDTLSDLLLQLVRMRLDVTEGKIL